MVRSAKDDLNKRRRAKARGQLLETLSYLDDAQALQLLWAVNALQSSNRPNLEKYLNYPSEAEAAKIGDKYFVLKWELENLILLLLSTPKRKAKQVIPSRYMEFNTVATLANLYKSAEEAESEVLITDANIIAEMQRYAHKQFFWQREIFQSERMYRYYYVYGQGKCADFFKEKYGLSIEEFAVTCVALYSQAQKFGWQVRPNLKGIDKLRPEIIDLTLSMVSKELQNMRKETKSRIDEVADKSQSKLTYLPSTLRHFPIISSANHNNQIIAPLPQLIIFRATSGLYYDLACGPQTLLEEASDRFERYGKKLIEARCPRFHVLREQEFGPRKARLKTPDLLVRDEGKIKVVCECKATKLTFIAQFSDNQYAEAPKAFDQIAKGMSQLWKFFSRARRGLYTAEKVAPDAHGVILTMDSWFQLEATQLPELRKKAEALVAGEPDILPEDMRDIVFCSIEELDDVLATSSEDEFLDTLRKSLLPEHHGWQLPSVRNPAWEKELKRNPYPFKIEEVLPLWAEFVR